MYSFEIIHTVFENINRAFYHYYGNNTVNMLCLTHHRWTCNDHYMTHYYIYKTHIYILQPYKIISFRNTIAVHLV